MGADWSIEQYRSPSGQIPYNGFVRALSFDARLEALSLERLLKRADHLKEPHSKSLGGGLFELRGPRCGVRIFYVFRPGRRVVVLTGYLKKRQDIPAGVLRLVRRYKADLESRDETQEI